ncbi:MAG: rRNA maturation RNase YbeY [Thermoleophilia bacterium]
MTPAVEIVVENRSGQAADNGQIAALAQAALARLGLDSGELGVALVSSREMALLNREHMGKSGPTDVLSFPLDMDAADSIGEVPRLLGDIIICPEVATAQAEARGNTTDAEISLLLMHGILHIAGYDHEIDAGEMEKMQNRLCAEFCRID